MGDAEKSTCVNNALTGFNTLAAAFNDVLLSSLLVVLLNFRQDYITLVLYILTHLASITALAVQATQTINAAPPQKALATWIESATVSLLVWAAWFDACIAATYAVGLFECEDAAYPLMSVTNKSACAGFGKDDVTRWLVHGTAFLLLIYNSLSRSFVAYVSNASVVFKQKAGLPGLIAIKVHVGVWLVRRAVLSLGVDASVGWIPFLALIILLFEIIFLVLILMKESNHARVQWIILSMGAVILVLSVVIVGTLPRSRSEDVLMILTAACNVGFYGVWVTAQHVQPKEAANSIKIGNNVTQATFSNQAPVLARGPRFRGTGGIRV